MTDIPEDIMQAARELALEWYDEESFGFAPMRDDFARAILGERQRCADVADAVVKANNTGSGFDSNVAYRTAWHIRRAILLPGKP